VKAELADHLVLLLASSKISIEGLAPAAEKVMQVGKPLGGR
jgi:hypothetical protein